MTVVASPPGGGSGAPAAPANAGTPPPGGPAGPERGLDYVKRVLGANDALIKTLGAAAGFAVAKLGVDRIGKGDYSEAQLVWVLTSVAGFAIGVVTAVGAVLAGVRGSRVSLAWLLSSRGGARVIKRLNRTKYIYGGAGSAEALQGWIRTLLREQLADPYTFLLSSDPAVVNKRLRLRALLKARENVVDQAVAERTQSSVLTWLMGAGAVLAAVSVAGFGYITNQAERAAKLNDAELERTHMVEDAALARTHELEDRAAEHAVTGELLPKAPSAVRIVIADAGQRQTLVASLSLDATKLCPIEELDSTLIQVAAPPQEVEDRSAVMRVVTPSTSACKPVDLWLPPEQVVRAPDPVAPASATEEGDTEAGG